MKCPKCKSTNVAKDPPGGPPLLVCLDCDFEWFDEEREPAPEEKK